MNLYRDRTGRSHFGSVDVPADILRDFSVDVRANLADEPRLGDVQFMIQLRGTKGMFKFDFHDDDTRENALNQMFNDIDIVSESYNLHNWHVDVGLEISFPGHVLQ